MRPAWAQNGLERFEKEIKPQFELEDLHLWQRRPARQRGLRAERRRRRHPRHAATGDKESTVKIQKVTVDALDFDRMKRPQGRRGAALRQAQDRGHDGRRRDVHRAAALRRAQVPVDIALDYRLDPATKVLDLKTLEIAMRGQAKFVPVAGDGRHQRQVERRRRRQGRRPPAHRLAHRSTTAACSPSSCRHSAKEEGLHARGAGADRGDWPSPPSPRQQGPDTLKALDAVASFIADWKSPKGTLVLGLKPAKTAGLSDLDKVMRCPTRSPPMFGFTRHAIPAPRRGGQSRREARSQIRNARDT